MNTKTSFETKKLSITALACIALTACSTEIHDREPETIILPHGYIGAFYIVFNAQNGATPRINEGKRIYEIPSNGVLYTQMKENTGWIDSELVQYFYRRPDGSLEPITAQWTTSVPDTQENRRENIITIFGGGIGVYHHPDIACQVVHQAFHVGTKKDILDSTNHFDIADAPDLNALECDDNSKAL